MGILQRAGHQIAAGETVRRRQAEKVVVQEIVLFVKLPIQIQVGLEILGDKGARQGVRDADGAFAQEHADGESGGRGGAAPVIGKVQHHILDRAVFTRDPGKRVDHQRDCISQMLLRLCRIIIYVLDGEFVESDISGVPDLLIGRRAVGIDFFPRLCIPLHIRDALPARRT